MAAPSIDAVSGLGRVVQWLESGFDPWQAAKDLRALQPALEAQAREPAELRAERDAENRNASRYADEVLSLRGEIAAANALKSAWEDRAIAAQSRIAALEDAVRVNDEALSFYACNPETCDCQPGEEQSDRVLCGHRAHTALSNGETNDR